MSSRTQASTRRSSAKAPAKQRNYDRESGKNRTSRPPKYEVDTPVQSEESDSDISEYEQKKKKNIKKKAAKVYQANTDSESEDYVPAKTKSKAPPKMEKEPELDNVEAVDPSAALLGPYVNRAVVTPVHDTPSTYQPSYENLFMLLHSMESCIENNPHFYSVFPEFFELCVRIYIGYCGVYQTLRNKESANISFTPEERRVFRRFETEMPAPTCVIPGPLVKWFEAIAWVDIGDKVYGKVFPVLPTTFPARLADFNVANRGFALFPPLPHMIAMLRNLATSAQSATLTNHVTKGDVYCPVAVLAAGTNSTFLGLNVGTNLHPSRAGYNTTTQDPDLSALFARPGLSYGLVAQPDCHSDAGFRAIGRYGLPNHQADGNNPIANIETYLRFDTASSPTLKWLTKLRRHAEVFSTFFTGGTTLDKIETAGDRRVLCLTRYTARAAAIAQPMSFVDSEYKGSLRHAHEIVSRYHLDDALLYRAALAAVCPVLMDADGAEQNNADQHLIYPDAMELNQAVGPVFRFYDRTANTYTGNYRNRWRKESTFPATVFTSNEDNVFRTMYKATGTTNDANVFVVNK